MRFPMIYKVKDESQRHVCNHKARLSTATTYVNVKMFQLLGHHGKEITLKRTKHSDLV